MRLHLPARDAAPTRPTRPVPSEVREVLDLRTPIVPAVLRNAAGIIGAAVLANGYQQERGRHTS